MNSLDRPGWARQPVLWEFEDFKQPPPDSAAVSVAGRQLFTPTSSQEPNWSALAYANPGVASSNHGTFLGHNGVWLMTTGAVSGNAIAIANQLTGAMTTGVVRSQGLYRWDWWVNVPTVTSVNSKFGVESNWSTSATGIGPSTSSSVLGLITSLSGNWQAITNNSQVTDTGVAVVAGAWYKLSAVFREMSFSVGGTGFVDYYVNEVLVTTHTIVPASPVSIGASLRTLTGATRTFNVDRCLLWVDGETMLG